MKTINAAQRHTSTHSFANILNKACVIHPRVCYMVILIGLPFVVLSTVTITTIAVMLPLSLLLGWI